MKKTLLYFFLIIAIGSTSHAEFQIMGAGGGAGGDLKADGTVPLTADWDAGAFEIRAESLYADTATADWILRWGDGDSGFKEPVDDFLDVWLSGTQVWRFSGTFLGASGSTGSQLRTAVSSSYTVPTLVIRGGDADTGPGSGAADSYSIITGGVEGFRVTESAGTVTTTFPNGYMRHHDVNAGAAALGPSAPTVTTIGTFRGLGFDADGELAFFTLEIPDDWDGISDMSLNVIWSPTSGDAIADTEDVDWSAEYRSIAEGEAMDNGTVVDAVATYLQSGGAGTDKEEIITVITLDYDNANQPLTAEDSIGIQFNRDVTGEANSYSGDAVVYRWELEYNATGMPAH